MNHNIVSCDDASFVLSSTFPSQSDFKCTKNVAKWKHWLAFRSPAGWIFLQAGEHAWFKRFLWATLLLTSYVLLAIHFLACLSNYLSDNVYTEMRLSSANLSMPDITICQKGTPTAILKRDADTTRLREMLFSFIHRKSDIVDKIKSTGYYYSRAEQLHKAPNLEQQHIGQYLVFCNYMGLDCDVRNFTLYRDPYFSNCFQFVANHRIIPSAGTVLRLGFRAMADIISHEDEYVATLHPAATRPDVLHEHVVVQTRGHTVVNFRARQFERMPRQEANCHNEANDVPYLFTNSDVNEARYFRYRWLDCFWSRLQEATKRQCGCLNAEAGFQSNLGGWRNCHALPIFTTNERYYMEVKLAEEEARSGKRDKTSIPKLTLAANRSSNSASNKVLQMQNNFNCAQKVYRALSETSPTQLQCAPACHETQFQTAVIFHEFTDKLLSKLGEHLMPGIRRRNQIKQHMRSLGLLDNATVTTLHFAGQQRATYTHRVTKNGQVIGNNLREQDIKRIQKYARENMAYLEIVALQAPVDHFVERLHYSLPIFLANVGGLFGLWAGISILSMLEVADITFHFLAGFMQLKVKKHVNVEGNKRETHQTSQFQHETAYTSVTYRGVPRNEWSEHESITEAFTCPKPFHNNICCKRYSFDTVGRNSSFTSPKLSGFLKGIEKSGASGAASTFTNDHLENEF